MYDRLLKLMKENNITPYRLSKETGITQATLSRWKTGKTDPSIETLKKIADYFGVSLDYLLGDVSDPLFCLDNKKILKEINSYESSDEKKETPTLTKKDERDISKKMQETLAQLEEQQSGLMFDGEPLDNETKELLAISLKNSLELAKKIAKQKYTPKKYRKKSE
ncbi:MAG: helix-turn-helix transcriptional regulator [Oscillospiraceae bacterium]|nr:helix-turn-helix transcriptional regulator [Oscillospiraceae bacterium]MCI2190942.1 helix-turn-helix transcriptional regulator [Oscillospiraceae bacterium]MCI2205926.1 helix-turn-helix transcriptional regulator [Oscillospiraceae bacterium]